MLSLDFIREHREKVVESARNKNREVDVEKIITLDDSRKQLIQEIQKLREERNVLAKSQGDEAMRERGRAIKEKIQELEKQLKQFETDLELLILQVPNVALDEVPVGPDASGNKEIKKWGTLPHFDFTPLSHVELGEKLDIIDLKRGSKVSGFRGYFLKNEGSILHLAILQFVLQKLIAKGYSPLLAPSLVRGFSLFGSGQFPWGEQETYKLNDDDAYLAGTAEVPVTAYFSDETLLEADLPKKFVAYSPCFRREAGSYGKDTKGLYRVHEFIKVEQVVLMENDIDKAREIHEELQRNCEEILEDLGIPYQVMLMCTGDMGEPQMKKYDTEAWMPGRQGYGETMSNSIMGDFQARRLNIRYKTKTGDTKYCFSLNNTAVASPRFLIAILENFQQKDGSIRIPKVLQSYCQFDTIRAK